MGEKDEGRGQAALAFMEMVLGHPGRVEALGLGMGAPLVLFAVGGGALLPKSGPWMLTVRNLFGALLMAVAIRCKSVKEAQASSAVVVLGDPTYYGRFGFRPASEFGLHCIYD